MNNDAQTIAVQASRRGRWLPVREEALVAFRHNLAEKAKRRAPGARLTPPVQDLATLVNTDPVLRMYLTQAIEQAIAAGYDLGYHTIDELMVLIDELMTYAPPFDTTELVGCPLNALLDWPMCMPAGFPLFRFPQLNAQLKVVLEYWCEFLSGAGSRTYLTKDDKGGWFSQKADAYIHIADYVHDETQPYYGFASWNAFFTRVFKKGVRPVDGPGDDTVIVSACEATPYNIQNNVQLTDRFWMKAQPYSLLDIFTSEHRTLAEQFVGGDIYQAFLSAYNYHRWHAPVTGTIVTTYNLDGTYYSDLEAEGLDPGGPNDSQGYISQVATRAVIVIACDDKNIGTVACVFVGMAEISSCKIGVSAGQRVTKGDEIGYFQYGGSTHCLIFEPGVIRSWVPKPPFDFNTPPIQLNKQIATANR
ncbi:phosphatidylserine decarboxylase family protein [Parafrankia sp. EUN1f]|uniref:phosphatidylserine decarboxylase family protein n=1 Tax=Parafrankia sp. EUN1f TaxID=102897 RepID=UPI0001C4475A|nr:phosphatidylserine decarboxylase family protein [Parafrankia sp. EUN1f]EFC82522.1 phosphatidylserine decarboxylase-related protein [Parafrankia sp. EUN1f]